MTSSTGSRQPLGEKHDGLASAPRAIMIEVTPVDPGPE